MLICLFISMLTSKERDKIIIKIKDSYYERTILGKEWSGYKDKS
jgi:hypothetical protein